MTVRLVEGIAVTRRFPVRRGLFGHDHVHAVSGVDLEIRRGEIVGVVGESGSGKSTLGRLLLGLQPLSGGQVLFNGVDLATLDRAALRRARRNMQLVFQDPYSSLDPRRRIGEQITEGLAIHGMADAAERRRLARELLDAVGLSPDVGDRLPGQFSGGQRQCIAIARALATRPEFIVADEPVSALDVSVQAQILNLLAKLRNDLGVSILFISHDLAVVRHLCDRVAVMYLGKIVETGRTEQVFSNPSHPYTQSLFAATPKLLEPIPPDDILPGEPPSPLAPPSGCVFRTRCRDATAECALAPIPSVEVAPAHFSSCIKLRSST